MNTSLKSTDEWVGAGGAAEAEAEAERPVRQAAERHIQRVLHHDVHLVLVRHAARLQHAEP